MGAAMPSLAMAVAIAVFVASVGVMLTLFAGLEYGWRAVVGGVVATAAAVACVVLVHHAVWVDYQRGQCYPYGSVYEHGAWVGPDGGVIPSASEDSLPVCPREGVR